MPPTGAAGALGFRPAPLPCSGSAQRSLSCGVLFMHESGTAVFDGDIYDCGNAEKSDIRPPRPLIDSGMIPSLSTGPNGKRALSQFQNIRPLQVRTHEG